MINKESILKKLEKYETNEILEKEVSFFKRSFYENTKRELYSILFEDQKENIGTFIDVLNIFLKEKILPYHGSNKYDNSIVLFSNDIVRYKPICCLGSEEDDLVNFIRKLICDDGCSLIFTSNENIREKNRDAFLAMEILSKKSASVYGNDVIFDEEGGIVPSENFLPTKFSSLKDISEILLKGESVNQELKNTDNFWVRGRNQKLNNFAIKYSQKTKGLISKILMPPINQINIIKYKGENNRPLFFSQQAESFIGNLKNVPLKTQKEFILKIMLNSIAYDELSYNCSLLKVLNMPHFFNLYLDILVKENQNRQEIEREFIFGCKILMHLEDHSKEASHYDLTSSEYFNNIFYNYFQNDILKNNNDITVSQKLEKLFSKLEISYNFHKSLKFNKKELEIKKVTEIKVNKKYILELFPSVNYITEFPNDEYEKKLIFSIDKDLTDNLTDEEVLSLLMKSLRIISDQLTDKPIDNTKKLNVQFREFKLNNMLIKEKVNIKIRRKM